MASKRKGAPNEGDQKHVKIGRVAFELRGATPEVKAKELAQVKAACVKHPNLRQDLLGLLPVMATILELVHKPAEDPTDPGSAKPPARHNIASLAVLDVLALTPPELFAGQPGVVMEAVLLALATAGSGAEPAEQRAAMQHIFTNSQYLPARVLTLVEQVLHGQLDPAAGLDTGLARCFVVRALSRATDSLLAALPDKYELPDVVRVAGKLGPILIRSGKALVPCSHGSLSVTAADLDPLNRLRSAMGLKLAGDGSWVDPSTEKRVERLARNFNLQAAVDADNAVKKTAKRLEVDESKSEEEKKEHMADVAIPMVAELDKHTTMLREWLFELTGKGQPSKAPGDQGSKQGQAAAGSKPAAAPAGKQAASAAAGAATSKPSASQAGKQAAGTAAGKSAAAGAAAGTSSQGSKPAAQPPSERDLNLLVAGDAGACLYGLRVGMAERFKAAKGTSMALEVATLLAAKAGARAKVQFEDLQKEVGKQRLDSSSLASMVATFEGWVLNHMYAYMSVDEMVALLHPHALLCSSANTAVGRSVLKNLHVFAAAAPPGIGVSMLAMRRYAVGMAPGLDEGADDEVAAEKRMLRQHSPELRNRLETLQAQGAAAVDLQDLIVPMSQGKDDAALYEVMATATSSGREALCNRLTGEPYYRAALRLSKVQLHPGAIDNEEDEQFMSPAYKSLCTSIQEEVGEARLVAQDGLLRLLSVLLSREPEPSATPARRNAFNFALNFVVGLVLPTLTQQHDMLQLGHLLNVKGLAKLGRCRDAAGALFWRLSDIQGRQALLVRSPLPEAEALPNEAATLEELEEVCINREAQQVDDAGAAADEGPLNYKALDKRDLPFLRMIYDTLDMEKVYKLGMRLWATAAVGDPVAQARVQPGKLKPAEQRRH